MNQLREITEHLETKNTFSFHLLALPLSFTDDLS